MSKHLAVACCTIVTKDYLPFAYALRDSLQRWQKLDLFVLITDEEARLHLDTDTERGATRHLHWRRLCASGLGREIAEKYRETDMDAFRWAVKPLLLKYLIEEAGHESALFLDNDLFFVSDFAFLLDELETSSILLTPHWRSSDPVVDAVNFELLFLEGLFNAGFVGASSRGLAALDWWARACLHACRKDAAAGVYVDQRYLDALPVLFEGVAIVRHRGCNVADWNRSECPRSISPDGTLWIGGRWPLVFLHLTRSLYATVLSGGDPCLAPILEQHVDTVRRYDPRFEPASRAKRTASLEPETARGAAKSRLPGRFSARRLAQSFFRGLRSG